MIAKNWGLAHKFIFYVRGVGLGFHQRKFTLVNKKLCFKGNFCVLNLCGFQCANYEQSNIRSLLYHLQKGDECELK